MANRQISPERKGVYYVGLALMAGGFLSFMSVFLTFASGMGGITLPFGFSGNHGDPFGMITGRAFGGMFAMMIGQFLMRIGRLGAAGSGMILDPEQTREDVEPWARMAGGVVKDALDETGLAQDREPLPFDEQLRRLHKLREEGLLSEEEYQAKKRDILKEI